MYNRLTKFPSLSVLLIILILVSCQREISFDLPRIVTEKDSTLLIKSVGIYDHGPGQDSIIETYSYDSINRKIFLTWNHPSNYFIPDGAKAELAYNDQWLLSHMIYLYPPGYSIQASDYTSIDISYDAQKVLQKIIMNYGDGSTETKTYTKTILSSGSYQLSWDETIQPDDISLRRAVFNADGKNIINVVDRSYVAETSPLGDPVFTNFIVSDTLFYDAQGSVNKIIRNEVDTLRHTNQTYVSYEYAGRQAKGDQLYNQRQSILNGIANMPFGDFDSPADAFGILSIALDYEYLQYSKYPVQTANIYNWIGNDYTFSGSSVFDSRDRLVNFKGFLLDIGITTEEYRIEYYK